MTKPAHRVLDTVGKRPFGQDWTVDDNHGQLQRPGGVQLGAGAVTTGVLRNHMRNAVCREQHQIARHFEGPATKDDGAIRQRQWRFRPVDEAQQIKMLRLGGKGLEALTADGEKHADRLWRQRCDGGIDIRHIAPIVAGGCDPGRSREGDERRLGLRAGGHRVAADTRRERMCRVDDVRDALTGEILDEAVDAAKAACSHGERLRDRRRGAARIGISGVDAGRGPRTSDLPGFRRTAEKENAPHG